MLVLKMARLIRCKKCRFYDWDRTNEADIENTKIGKVAKATACWCKLKKQYMPFDSYCSEGKPVRAGYGEK
jgi:hypothetical protein